MAKDDARPRQFAGRDLSDVDSIDAAVLTPIVRNALGSPAFAVTDWTRQPVRGARASTTAGIYRFVGNGPAAGSARWSVILKVIRRVGGSVGPADLLYWKREPLVLTSGLLDSLPPGFRAPRWYGIEESDDAIWIWMEDAPDTIAHPWSLERFALAARHLGAFNGAYLAGRPLPDFPWLNRGLLANYLDQAEKDLPFVSTLRDHPLVRRGWPGDTLARMWELWGEKANLIAALARLPQTLCHADAQDQNLVGDGSETVALDWAWTGVGAVGEELAVLLRSRLRETDSYAALDAALFPSYLAGLREAGWCGDERLVRLGYTVTIALRYALNCVPVRAFEDDALRVRFEESLDWPLERIVDWLGALRVFALDRADEARALIQATA